MENVVRKKRKFALTLVASCLGKNQSKSIILRYPAVIINNGEYGMCRTS